MRIVERTRAVLLFGGPVLSVFILGHFAHHLVTGALIPLLPLLRNELNLDYTGAGLLMGAFTLTYGFMQIPVAAAADRVGRRRVLAISLWGTGISAILLGLPGGYWQVVVLFIAIGFFGSGYHAPASAFLSTVFDKPHRGRTLGFHTVGGSSSLMITPLLAVTIAAISGSWRIAFVILGIAPLLVGFVVLTATRRQDAAHMKAAAVSGGERVSLVEIARLIGLLVCIAVVAAMLAWAVMTFLPLYLVDKHGVAPELAGILAGVMAAGGVVGAPLGGALSDRFGRAPVIVASLLLAGPLLYIMTIMPFGWGMIALIVVYGLVLSMRMPVMESMIADVVPAFQRGTALGVYYFMSQETAAVVTPLIGHLIDVYGADPTFTGLAAAAGVAGVLGLLIRGPRPARTPASPGP